MSNIRLTFVTLIVYNIGAQRHNPTVR